MHVNFLQSVYKAFHYSAVHTTRSERHQRRDKPVNCIKQFQKDYSQHALAVVDDAL